VGKGRGTIKPREMEIIFRKLMMTRIECDHHVRGYFEIDGRKLFATHYSFGKKDIYGHVLKNIMRDLNADEDIFFGLIDCYVDRDAYISALKDKRII
jgi:hypothetical protein